MDKKKKLLRGVQTGMPPGRVVGGAARGIVIASHSDVCLCVLPGNEPTPWVTWQYSIFGAFVTVSSGVYCSSFDEALLSFYKRAGIGDWIEPKPNWSDGEE